MSKSLDGKRWHVYLSGQGSGTELWAFAANARGEFEQIANVRRWTATTSESVSSNFTGKTYGKGRKGWLAAQADVGALNAQTPRPVR